MLSMEHLPRGGAGALGLERVDSDEAFRAAALACLDGLYGFALVLARERAAAEDLVQETYARALAARRKASPGDNLRGWLFTILANVWRNECRRRRPEGVADVEELAGAQHDARLDPYALLDARELRERLRAGLDGLPEAFREVIVLRCVEGFSYRQVAEIVGCPAGTVMSRLSRGRALLRAALGAAEGVASKGRG
jgi:RNA polymerase sigma-70 factor (ECF subfamily)